jgi:hypothetical protein
MEGSGKEGHKTHRRHRHGHEYGHESSGRHRHRRHRSKSRDGERRRQHHSSRDEHRSRSRHRHRDEPRRNRYERSRYRDRRSPSRRRDRSDDIRDPVTEHPQNDDSEYSMTGGAGPVGTLHDGHRKPDAPLPRDGNRPGSGSSGYQTSWQDLTPEPRSRSRSRGRRGRDSASGRRAPTPHRSARKSPKERSRTRSRSRRRKETPRPERKRSHTPHRSHRRKARRRSSSRQRDRSRTKQSDLRAGCVGESRSPTRQQKGPDGTPFGSLPKYKSKAGIAMGLGNHFMNTYRHIKAEHDAGHRTKGVIETALDEMRKKRADAKGKSDKQESGRTRERERVRKSEPERTRWAEGYPGKTRGEEWKPVAAETEASGHHRSAQDERRRRDRDGRRQREHEDWEKSCSVPLPEIRVEPPTSSASPTRQPTEAPCEVSSPTPPTSSLPPAPEPPNWHARPSPPPPIREVEYLEREASPPREPSVRGVDDASEGGAAASYYDETPRSPTPGSFEDREEMWREEHDEPLVRDGVGYPDTPPSPVMPSYPDTPRSPISGGFEDCEMKHEEEQPLAHDEMLYPDTPPSPIIPPYPDTPPSPVGSEGPSGSSSPIMSHAPRASSPLKRFTPAFWQSIPMPIPQQLAPPVPPPPGLPPLPTARPPNMAALLGDIRGPPKLRSVAASDRKDSSINPRAGRVVYDETAHSRDVEEHERAQARESDNQSPVRGSSAWSTAYSVSEEPDVRPEPNRAFRDELARKLGAGSGTFATGLRRGSDDSSLTGGSRRR